MSIEERLRVALAARADLARPAPDGLRAIRARARRTRRTAAAVALVTLLGGAGGGALVWAAAQGPDVTPLPLPLPSATATAAPSPTPTTYRVPTLHEAVAVDHTGTLVVLDTRSGAVVRRVAQDPAWAAGDVHVDLDSRGRRDAYVASGCDGEDKQVSHVDLFTNAVRSYPFRGRQVEVDPNGERLVLLTCELQVVTVLRAVTGAVERELTFADGELPPFHHGGVSSADWQSETELLIATFDGPDGGDNDGALRLLDLFQHTSLGQAPVLSREHTAGGFGVDGTVYTVKIDCCESGSVTTLYRRDGATPRELLTVKGNAEFDLDFAHNAVYVVSHRDLWTWRPGEPARRLGTGYLSAAW